MSKIPYLHPSQRNLRNEQVGPSNHQNEYHVGVLQDNWVEDRASFGQKQVKVKLDSLTVAQASYQKPPEGMNCKPSPYCQRETERHLLFGHGSDLHCTDYNTIHNMTYNSTKDPSARNSLVAKKKAQWESDNDPEADAYVTTRKLFHDSTSQYIYKQAVPGANSSTTTPPNSTLNETQSSEQVS
eukprot:TRINITY_DN419_c4_g1_i1.p1 TRINITY_DN419_c4_g1~~TRINITY_DN419_c4_g1_i1.p1  ORF type:complete len:184 (+),score=27.43 TRINITY_DN419_c4_g1_i1:154-705(+)